MNRRNSSRENHSASTCSSSSSSENCSHSRTTATTSTSTTISRSNSFNTQQQQQQQQLTTPHEHHQQQQQQLKQPLEQPINLSLFDPLPHLPSRLRQATLKLVPPPNFGFIEGSLFRAGEPAELSHNFIQRLNLHSLLWLAPHPPSLKFQEFLLLHSIKFHDLGIQHAASLDAVTEDAVTHALQLILNPSIYPLMIMCGGGSHRTGTVVGCLRKLQGWNLASIFEEYRRYAGAQHHIMNEQFIEFYNVSRLANRLTSDQPNHNQPPLDHHHHQHHHQQQQQQQQKQLNQQQQQQQQHHHQQQGNNSRTHSLPTPAPSTSTPHPHNQLYKIATPSGLHFQN